MKKDKFKPILIAIIFVLFQVILYKLVSLRGYNPFIIRSKYDDMISFNILAIIPYCIWYLLLFLVPYIIYKYKKEDYSKYITLYFVISIIADIIYLIYPTTVIRPEVDADGILYFITKIIFMIDNPPLNCCPSLHCAIALLFIIFMNNKKYPYILRIPIILISIIVIPCTLIIKQHAIIDAILGCFLTIICYLLYNKTKYICYLETKIKKLFNI